MPTEFESSLESRRQRLVANAQDLLDTAEREGRSPTEEEIRQFDNIHKDVESIGQQITMRQRQSAMAAQLGEMASPVKVPGVALDREVRSVEALMASDELDFRSWAANGKLRDSSAPASIMIESQEMTVLRNIFTPVEERRRQLEQRALTTVTDTGGTEAAGGYLTSESMAAAVELAMKDYNAFRQAPVRMLATPTGEPIQWPLSNDTANKGFRLAQGGNASSNITDPAFTNKALNAWTYSSGLVNVQRQLLQDSRYDFGGLLGEMLGIRISRVQAEEDTLYAAAVSGGAGPGPDRAAHTAANGPEAVISFLLAIAGSGGVGASLRRASSDVLKYETLIDLEMSVDGAYRRSAAAGFMFSSKGLAEVKKLADDQNRPLWLPGNIAGGNPPTLYGYPYFVNENMNWIPASGNATEGIVLFGDFRSIVLRDTMDLGVQRLDERFAELFQVGFVGFSRHDLRVIDAGTHPLKVITSVP